MKKVALREEWAAKAALRVREERAAKAALREERAAKAALRMREVRAALREERAAKAALQGIEGCESRKGKGSWDAEGEEDRWGVNETSHKICWECGKSGHLQELCPSTREKTGDDWEGAGDWHDSGTGGWEGDGDSNEEGGSGREDEEEWQETTDHSKGATKTGGRDHHHEEKAALQRKAGTAAAPEAVHQPIAERAAKAARRKERAAKAALRMREVRAALREERSALCEERAAKAALHGIVGCESNLPSNVVQPMGVEGAKDTSMGRYRKRELVARYQDVDEPALKEAGDYLVTKSHFWKTYHVMTDLLRAHKDKIFRRLIDNENHSGPGGAAIGEKQLTEDAKIGAFTFYDFGLAPGGFSRKLLEENDGVGLCGIQWAMSKK